LTRIPRQFKGERVAFNNQCWDNWTTKCKRVNLDLYLTPYTKINSKWIRDLNVRAKMIKLFEENISVNLRIFGLGNGVILVTPKAQATKLKRDKLDFIKIQNFVQQMTLLRRLKEPHRMGRNICIL